MLPVAAIDLTVCVCLYDRALLLTYCMWPATHTRAPTCGLGWLSVCVPMLTLCFCLHVCVTDLLVIETRPWWHHSDIPVRSSCPPSLSPTVDVRVTLTSPRLCSHPPTPYSSSPLLLFCPFLIFIFSFAPLCLLHHLWTLLIFFMLIFLSFPLDFLYFLTSSPPPFLLPSHWKWLQDISLINFNLPLFHLQLSPQKK